MLSQKMSKEFLLVAKGINVAQNKQNLRSTMELYSASLDKLVSGSAAEQIPPPPTSGIADQLTVVEGLWTTYSALLTANVDLSPITATTLESVATQSLPILTEMNQGVGMYATAAGTVAPGAVVNIAGRQRMLSQKMSKEALLVGLSVNTAASLTALEATKNLFVTSHAGLVHGSTALGPASHDGHLHPRTAGRCRRHLGPIRAAHRWDHQQRKCQHFSPDDHRGAQPDAARGVEQGGDHVRAGRGQREHVRPHHQSGVDRGHQHGRPPAHAEPEDVERVPSCGEGHQRCAEQAKLEEHHGALQCLAGQARERLGRRTDSPTADVGDRGPVDGGRGALDHIQRPPHG
mmetsp:Transcript_43306/g.90172  ORF Transcript_43306/g.90172 Transcript_43306/m.90172 type:complete len:347 (-) Transcript_43306:169-1209(-)